MSASLINCILATKFPDVKFKFGPAPAIIRAVIAKTEAGTLSTSTFSHVLDLTLGTASEARGDALVAAGLATRDEEGLVVASMDCYLFAHVLSAAMAEKTDPLRINFPHRGDADVPVMCGYVCPADPAIHKALDGLSFDFRGVWCFAHGLDIKGDTTVSFMGKDGPQDKTLEEVARGCHAGYTSLINIAKTPVSMDASLAKMKPVLESHIAGAGLQDALGTKDSIHYRFIFMGCDAWEIELPIIE